MRWFKSQHSANRGLVYFKSFYLPGIATERVERGKVIVGDPAPPFQPRHIHITPILKW